MSDCRPPPKSLIIVGAGMAGIKLAHFCLQYKPEMKLTIIEANDNIGGRVRNFNFEGHTVEMGANWISGLENTYDNPIWKLAKEVNLDGHFVDRAENQSVCVLDCKGNDIHEEYFKSMNRFEKIYEKAVKACSERGIKPQTDVDAQSFLEEFGWKEDELSDIDKLVQFNMLEVWLADGLDNCSVAHNFEEGANDVDLGKEEFFVEDQRGFRCIMDAMSQDIKGKGAVIKLGTQVTKIRYLPGNVVVIGKDLKSGQAMEYTAESVVCTVSLGVLQHNMIDFEPPFPEWKTKALNQMKMFTFSKVYAKFEDNFCEDENQIIFCDGRKGRYPLWIRYRNTAGLKQNIFMCYLGGNEAERVESLTTEEIKDEIEELFRNAFNRGPKNMICSKIFRPLTVAVTNWSKNRLFCGSYSLYPVHAYAEDPQENLSRGLTGTKNQDGPIVLHFAGEGFDDKFNGWVQGAYRSGESVAKFILGRSTKSRQD